MSEFESAVAKAIELAKRAHGDPEYTYYKQCVTWNARTKTHFVPVTPSHKVPITREEYEKHATQAKINEVERFMGKLKQTYYRYEREQVAPAWREKLLELVPNYPE
jgi:hypothetical protein